MIGEVIVFGKNRKDQLRYWKAVHETDTSVTYMLDDLGTERVKVYDVQGALKGDFVILTDEEQSRVIPNEAGDLVWLPSVKQLGFVPVGICEECGRNGFPKDRVPERVWKEETFQYFSELRTAPERRAEFGEWYWVGASYGSNPGTGPVVAEEGGAGFCALGSKEIHPCITLKKEES